MTTMPVFPVGRIPEATATWPDTDAGHSDLSVEERVAQATRYIRAVPGAIEGQGGDVATFQLAATLIRGFALPPEVAMPLMLAWNQTCTPPWTSGEIEAKVTNALKHAQEPEGGRLREQNPTRAPKAASSPGTSQRTDTPRVETAPADDRSTEARATYPCTDAGNAEYFAARYGHQLRYDHQLGKWLEWESPIWRPDADASVRRLAKDAMRARYRDAASIEDVELLKKASRWATGSENRSRLDALVYLAQAEILGIPLRPLDSDEPD